jgi:PP-loop superfamily ATP-utilizing enzyme
MGGYVSVEVGKDEVKKLINETMKNQVVIEFQKIGFLDVRFDENGYESGKLNKKLA